MIKHLRIGDALSFGAFLNSLVKASLNYFTFLIFHYFNQITIT